MKRLDEHGLEVVGGTRSVWVSCQAGNLHRRETPEEAQSGSMVYSRLNNELAVMGNSQSHLESLPARVLTTSADHVRKK